jgi:membrane protease YdiL (CAAX protease family)
MTPAAWLAWLDRLFGPVPDLPRPQALDADRRAAIALWSAAVLLILLIFRAGFPTPGSIYAGWAVDPEGLAAHLYWASWRYLLYLAVPLAIILFVFRESPARYGLRLYLTKRTALAYLAMLLVMVPLLFWASTRGDFQRTYPFVSDLGSNWVRTLLIWDLAYAASFICLEFFFRGYLLFALEEKLGLTAVAVTTIPYSLIHFAKPFPEAMAAIVAGTVLGFLALRTRSIVGGAFIHVCVAVGMDVLAVWRAGYF